MTYYSHSQKYKKREPISIYYLIKREHSLKDFTNRIPDKIIEKVRLPWGFYGYTYIGHNKAWLNELLDQVPYMKQKTDLHEVIHPPDEYEARVLTDWMLEREPDEKVKEKVLKADFSQNKEYKKVA